MILVVDLIESHLPTAAAGELVVRIEQAPRRPEPGQRHTQQHGWSNDYWERTLSRVEPISDDSILSMAADVYQGLKGLSKQSTIRKKRFDIHSDVTSLRKAR